MTSPIAIRGVEQWNRWSTDHSPLLISEESEGRDWIPGGSIWILPLVTYGFILLALCLLFTDTFRLAFAHNSSHEVSTRTQAVRSVRMVPGSAHVGLASVKRHSGL